MSVLRLNCLRKKKKKKNKKENKITYIAPYSYICTLLIALTVYISKKYIVAIKKKINVT